jgi:asparagine synthetase A
MTVENADVVDFVAYDEGSQIVRLVIADHLDWDDELTHLYTLQEKVNKYLAFVESGELVEQFPHLASSSIHIDVEFLYQPTAHARVHFLDKVGRVIQSSGMEFTWHVHKAS